MATLTDTVEKPAPPIKDVFEKPSFQDGVRVILPGVVLGIILAVLCLSGLVGGKNGLLGGKDGPLERVPGVLGALMLGGSGLIFGVFMSVLVLTRRSQGRRQRYWRQTFQAYTYLLPSVIILYMFTFAAITYGFYVSFHRFGVGEMAQKKTPEFIGLSNYSQAIIESGTRQTEFWKSMLTSLWFTVGAIPVQVVLALIIAVMLFRKMRGVGFYRTSFFLPYVTATIALAEVWVLVFSRGEGGIVNSLFESLGLARQGWLMESKGIFELLLGVQAPSWLPEWARSIVLGPSQALVVIMMYSVWKYFGFSLVILLAGLSNIDPEMYEAAQIDGASTWHSFRRITIPMLSPSLYYVTLISTIGSLKSFDTLYQLSIRASAGSGPGGPLDTTQTLVIYIYNQFVRDHYFGYASALAMILFAIILIITLVQQRVLGRRVFYS